MSEIKLRQIPTLESLTNEGISEVKARRIIENTKFQNEMLEEIIKIRKEK